MRFSFIRYLIAFGVNIQAGVISRFRERTEDTESALAIQLSVSGDRYYVAFVTVGTPGTSFALALDNRINGVLVADAASKQRLKTDVFNRSASSTYELVQALSDRYAGTDYLVFPRFDGLAFSQYGPTSVVSLLLDNASDPAIQPFLALPVDGVFFYRPAISRRMITYGQADQENCGHFDPPAWQQLSCRLPMLPVDGITLGSYDAEGGWSAVVVTVLHIIVSWDVFNNINAIIKARKVDDEYVVNCNDKPVPPFELRINHIQYKLEYPYLVDRVGDECVLLVRPSDSLGNEYCKRFCGNSVEAPYNCSASNFGIVLGLPFLHRFCLYHDESYANSRVARRKTNILRSVCEYGQHGTRPPTKPSPSTTLKSGNSTKLRNPIPVAAVVASVVGLLTSILAATFVWQCKPRSLRFIGALRSMAEVRHLPASTQAFRPRADDCAIDASNLRVCEDQQIGSGAFARVFLGELRGPHSKRRDFSNSSTAQSTKVAVKQSLLDTEEARHEMQRELELMKKVGRHCHVVNLVGYVYSSELLIVIEYCAKGDLHTYLRAHLRPHKDAIVSASEGLQTAAYSNSRISLQDLIKLFWQISDGMTFLNSKGYVHRDLAARNILLTEAMVAKISDFGLCRFTNENLYVTGRGGKLTVRWMAPETLSTASFSTASDV
ncbi:tyrosine-protein kinase F09A5.2-like [Aphelenchoides avenae]|nr:tyrosine-protein kinase F09A5.2-like [Aphelenchus avenae]